MIDAFTAITLFVGVLAVLAILLLAFAIAFLTRDDT